MSKGLLHSLFPNLNAANLLVFFGWVFLIWFLLFLIFREIKCWYYKINDMISLLQSIDRRLEQLNDKLNITQDKTDTYQNTKEQDSSELKQMTTYEVAATSEQVKGEPNINDLRNKDSDSKKKIVEFMTKERHLSDIFLKK